MRLVLRARNDADRTRASFEETTARKRNRLGLRHGVAGCCDLPVKPTGGPSDPICQAKKDRDKKARYGAQNPPLERRLEEEGRQSKVGGFGASCATNPIPEMGLVQNDA